MARLLLLKETTRTLKRESWYTIGRIEDDPLAGGLIGLTAGWLGRIQSVEESVENLERQRIFAAAARTGADTFLDGVARQFGRNLKAAVKEDYDSLRWQRYWRVAPSAFVAQPLQDQVNAMKGWAEDPDPVLVPLLPRVEAAILRTEKTIARDATLKIERGKVWILRQSLVDHLNNARQELEGELEAIARREDLERTWVASFFRTTRPPREEDEGEEPPPTPTP